MTSYTGAPVITSFTGAAENFTLLASQPAFEPAGDSNFYLVALGIIIPAAAYATLCGFNLAHRPPQPRHHRRHRRVRGEYDDPIDLADTAPWSPDQLRVPLRWLI